MAILQPFYKCFRRLYMKLAVLTYDDKGAFATGNVADENKILDKLLKEIGIPAQFAVWSDQDVDWSQFTHILIKSPWDYFDRYQEFLKWCHQIKSRGIAVYNDIDTVLWNADKHYLLDIENKGFPIVPTAFIPAGAAFELYEFFEMFEVDRIVMKPAVSGGSKNTLLLTRDEISSTIESLRDAMQQEDFMVQPFVPEIADIGEFSYIFFNGKFSHAILKSPKAGEFRVQHFFGGSVHPVSPSNWELQYLQSLVDACAPDTLYARVDGIWRAEQFFLMELELIEPYLFLYTDPLAESNYQNAIKSILILD
jgi:glutathione synthase/RimK-type ligase-like ATP-grasp enzyme